MVKGKDVDITDADLMGSALDDNDLILIDDGAGGTQDSTKKSVVSRVWDYIVSKLSAATSLTVGNYTFETNQTVGAGQDNYVLTYDNSDQKSVWNQHLRLSRLTERTSLLTLKLVVTQTTSSTLLLITR